MLRASPPHGEATLLAASARGLSSVAPLLTIANSSNYGYTLNDANQRTAMTQPNGQTWNWSYDSLGQVNRANLQRSSDSAPYPGRQYAYNYDTIGNRLTASQGDAADPATHSSVTGYTPNGLNQYSTITHPAEAVASGEAHEAATVTVNGQPTTRLGPYFHKALPVPNSGSAAIETPLTIAASENGTTESEIRTALTLPATESPEYDEDGNLTADSLWTYTWDAENRLIAMESAPSLPAAKRVKLAFAYDANSRRIRKQVWQAQPAAPHAWIATQTRRFCYEGWNLILELDPDGTAFRQYLWGLDLSNTPQGAGGVSGLLCITLRSINNQPSTINYYPAYDRNGNLTGLTTATTGEESATFTYEPFGQPLTATGPAAKANPFGFSTKYTDPETALCYYGYRYYDPKNGRWLGRDPIEENGGVNLYGMIENELNDHVDILGLWTRDSHIKLIKKWIEQVYSNPRHYEGIVYVGTKAEKECYTVDLIKEFTDANDFVDKTAEEKWYNPLGFDSISGFYNTNTGPNAFLHSMRAPYQSQSEAKALRDNYVNLKVLNAYKYFGSIKRAGRLVGDITIGDSMKRIASLIGEAQHPVSDETSPSHVGFQVWGIDTKFGAGYRFIKESKKHVDGQTAEVYDSLGDTPVNFVRGVLDHHLSEFFPPDK